jgi:hypothetical protein
MKKGLIGPFGLGVLHGLSQALSIAGKTTQEHGPDLEAIFYATAFQAGIDEFMVPELEETLRPTSDFLVDRTSYVAAKRSDKHWRVVDAAFSAYLPDDWEQNIEYSSVWRIQSLVVDLLDAMSAGASLLAPDGIPDMAEIEMQLPDELSIPVRSLLSAISELPTSGLVFQRTVASEDVERFNEIISSDLFSKYAAAHSLLDSLDAPAPQVLPMVVSSARSIFRRHKKLLKLRTSGIGILQLTPKFVDTVFGRLPGLLAEVAAKLGGSLLESRRRIVIYDFEATLKDVLISNLVRMISTAEAKRRDPQSDPI